MKKTTTIEEYGNKIIVEVARENASIKFEPRDTTPQTFVLSKAFVDFLATAMADASRDMSLF